MYNAVDPGHVNIAIEASSDHGLTFDLPHDQLLKESSTDPVQGYHNHSIAEEDEKVAISNDDNDKTYTSDDALDKVKAVHFVETSFSNHDRLSNVELHSTEKEKKSAYKFHAGWKIILGGVFIVLLIIIVLCIILVPRKADKTVTYVKTATNTSIATSTTNLQSPTLSVTASTVTKPTPLSPLKSTSTTTTTTAHLVPPKTISSALSPTATIPPPSTITTTKSPPETATTITKPRTLTSTTLSLWLTTLLTSTKSLKTSSQITSTTSEITIFTSTTTVVPITDKTIAASLQSPNLPTTTSRSTTASIPTTRTAKTTTTTMIPDHEATEESPSTVIATKSGTIEKEVLMTTEAQNLLPTNESTSENPQISNSGNHSSVPTPLHYFSLDDLGNMTNTGGATYVASPHGIGRAVRLERLDNNSNTEGQAIHLGTFLDEPWTLVTDNDFTVELWYKIDCDMPGYAGVLTTLALRSEGIVIFCFRAKLRYQVWMLGTTVTIDTVYGYQPNKWIKSVMVWQAANKMLKVYHGDAESVTIVPEPASRGSNSQSNSNDGKLYLGKALTDGGWYGNVEVDDLYIYDTALSDSDIVLSK